MEAAPGQLDGDEHHLRRAWSGEFNFSQKGAGFVHGLLQDGTDLQNGLEKHPIRCIHEVCAVYPDNAAKNPW